MLLLETFNFLRHNCIEEDQVFIMPQLKITLFSKNLFGYNFDIALSNTEHPNIKRMTRYISKLRKLSP
jgi:hypothetical protein